MLLRETGDNPEITHETEACQTESPEVIQGI